MKRADSQFYFYWKISSSVCTVRFKNVPHRLSKKSGKFLIIAGLTLKGALTKTGNNLEGTFYQKGVFCQVS